jgi:hypothetical protein
VAGCSDYGDAPSGSGFINLVSWTYYVRVRSAINVAMIGSNDRMLVNAVMNLGLLKRRDISSIVERILACEGANSIELYINLLAECTNHILLFI